MLPSPTPRPDRDGPLANGGREQRVALVLGGGNALAANPPERRLERLREFWAEAALHTFGVPAPAGPRGRQVYNGAHAALTAVLGRPSIFGHRYPGLWSVLPGMPGDVALYDHAPLRRTLERLVDFDRLNRAEVRFALACTDLE